MSRYVIGSVVTLILLFAVITAFEFHPVLANSPSVDAPIPWTSGTHTILNFTVHHDTTSLPSPTHYIDQVNITVDGTPHFINLTNSPQQPQFFFVVQYDMGEVTGTPMVNASAHCTVHLWGSASPSVQVPEFSLAQILLIIAIVTTAVVFLQYKGYGSKKRILRTVKNTTV
jgi:hypothetical protein